MRDNEIINLKYIINNKDKMDFIKIEIKYLENGKHTEKKYEIKPEEICEGEELSKLIINNYILNDPDITDKEKIKLSLKYQILTKYTSLFAEVELSDKITEEMKTKIIGDKNKNIIRKKQITHPTIVNSFRQDYMFNDLERASFEGLEESMLFEKDIGCKLQLEPSFFECYECDNSFNKEKEHINISEEKNCYMEIAIEPEDFDNSKKSKI